MKKILFTTALILLITAAQAQWIQQVSNTDGNLHTVYFTGPNKGHVAYGLSGYGGVLRTTDGNTWNDQLLSFAEFTSVHFTNEDTGLIAGGYGLIMKTTDAGVTWNTTNITPPGSNWIADIEYIGPNTCVAGSMNGDLYKSANGGSTWSTQTLNLSINTIHFTSSTTGYAAGWDGTFAYLGVVAKTTDGGATWTYYYVPKNYSVIRGIHFPSAGVGYAAGETTILKTTDAGTTWTLLNVDSTQHYNDVFFADNNTGYAVTSSGMIFKTADGGNTWNSQVSGTTHSLNSIHCTDPNTCYAVGDSGVVLKTTNGGGVGINEIKEAATLNAYPNPFSDHTVIDIEHSQLQHTVFTLFDVAGREIPASIEVRENQIVLSRKDLSPGIYFFTLRDENILLGKGKLVIE